MTVCPNINCVDISEGALQGTQSKSMIQHFIQILYKALSMEEAKVPIALTVLSINRGGDTQHSRLTLSKRWTDHSQSQG